MCQVTTHGLCEPINLTKLWFLTFHGTGKVITKYYLWMGGKCIVHWSIYSLPLQFHLVSLISLPEETHCESPEKAIKIINLFPARTWTQIFQSKFLHLTIGLMPLLQVTWVKFPHSPILHYAFSSWTEKTMTKTMTKTIHFHWENRFVLQ